jgi:hypothetical protein
VTRWHDTSDAQAAAEVPGLAVEASRPVTINPLRRGWVMTGEPGTNRAPRTLTDERAQGQDVFGLGEGERDAMLAWVGENLPLVRRSVSGQRVLYWSLGFGFVLGLAAHVGGFLLKASVTTEPLALMADLLYALGWAMWTGVVVVVFVQIYPESKKRQYKQALNAYEAAVGAAEGRQVMSMDEFKRTLIEEMIEKGWRAPDGRTDAGTDALAPGPAPSSSSNVCEGQ